MLIGKALRHASGALGLVAPDAFLGVNAQAACL
jgi:hypothetical protein